MSNYSSGYALRRNGSCLSTETDCGQTTAPFHACCPGNMFCPGPRYNVMCCPSDADCSNIIGENCANGTGDLYSSTTEIKREGFCCQRGKYAFALANSGVGCADDLSDLQVSMTQLAVLSSATPAPSSTSSTPSITASFLSSTTSSTTSLSTSSTTSLSPTSSSEVKSATTNNTGAIVGGTLGGIVGAAVLLLLIWFFLRRRNKQDQGNERESKSPNLGSQARPVELTTGKAEPLIELSG